MEISSLGYLAVKIIMLGPGGAASCLVTLVLMWLPTARLRGGGGGVAGSPLRTAESTPAQKFMDINADSCDWTIWDYTEETKGVRNIRAGCAQGLIDWRNPYGAIRISLAPPSGASLPFEACFRATSFYTPAKIYFESPSGSTGSSLQQIVVFDKRTSSSMDHEACFRSDAGKAVTLYLETDADLDTVTIGHIELEYDISRIQYQNSQMDMAECRPCTEEELLQTVCSSDFVLTGSMLAVHHNPVHSETEIHLRIKKIYQQSQPLFQQQPQQLHPHHLQQHSPVSESLSNMDQYQYPDPLDSRGSTRHPLSSDGAVVVPHQCAIRHGHGDFLFIGRIRLQRALLKCAPRLEEFEQTWKRAVRQGRNPCVLTP